MPSRQSSRSILRTGGLLLLSSVAWLHTGGVEGLQIDGVVQIAGCEWWEAGDGKWVVGEERWEIDDEKYVVGEGDCTASPTAGPTALETPSPSAAPSISPTEAPTDSLPLLAVEYAFDIKGDLDQMSQQDIDTTKQNAVKAFIKEYGLEEQDIIGVELSQNSGTITIIPNRRRQKDGFIRVAIQVKPTVDHTTLQRSVQEVGIEFELVEGGIAQIVTSGERWSRR
jgi:hypothetical protein